MATLSISNATTSPVANFPSRALRGISSSMARLAHGMVLISFLIVSMPRASATSSSSSSDQDEIGVDVDLLFSTPEGRRGIDDVEAAPLIAACVAFVFGAVLCFAGARVARYAALGCAFFDGAFGTAAVLEKVLKYAKLEGVVSWTCFFLGGILCCLVVLSIKRADVLCLGVTAGLITAFTCLTTFGYLIAPRHPDAILYVLLVVLGIISGLLTLKTQPTSLLPATSWIGSNMATWGIGYFFGQYPNGIAIDKYRRPSDGNYELPTAWWAYLGGTLGLFIMGLCVQAYTFNFEQHHFQHARRANATGASAVVADLDSSLDACERQSPYVAIQTPSQRAAPQRSAPRRSSSRLTSRYQSEIV